MLHKRMLFPALGMIGFMILVGVVMATAQESNERPAGETAATLSTTFTYQGRLIDEDGDPVDGSCAFTFELYDVATGGSPLGAVDASADVADGTFTVPLDFGAAVFDGGNRYLDVAVDCGDGETHFAERQPLTPVPYARYAAGTRWSGIASVPADIADGDDDTTYSAGFGLGLTDTQFDVRTDTIQQRVAGSCAPGEAIRSIAADGTVTCEAAGDASYSVGTGLSLNGSIFSLDTGYTDGRYWTLGGNAGTNPATDTLGTTDAMTLTVIVSNSAALRIGPAADGAGYYSPNVIAGSATNVITDTNAAGVTIAGGGNAASPNRVGADYGTVGGGRGNTASGTSATVSGGSSNNGIGDNVTVGGGEGNVASNLDATVGGGSGNTAGGGGSTVGGGGSNTASGDTATVGGGADNVASDRSDTVGGGERNMASGGGATVGGGVDNVASGRQAVVGGGSGNVADGGVATVGGGVSNSASGEYATVAGGWSNSAAGEYSFAAGRQAQAVHNGTFVWGDSTAADIYSGNENAFVVRANGGVWFGRATGEFTATVESGTFISTTTGAYLTDGGAWTNASDRASKEQFEAVDGRDVLLRLMEVPIETWSYRAEEASVRHMGPVAQEFYAAFGLGGDDTSISTVDADGVALAAIQGLHTMVEEKDSRIAALEEENAAQQEQIDDLRRLVEKELAGGRDARSGLPLPDPGWIVAGLLFGWVMWRRRPEGRLL